MPARTSPPSPPDATAAAAHQSPPPSPSLPRPPVEDAPGPRAQAFCNAFDKALESTLRRCSYDNFAACFPTPAEHRAETLDQFWREFVGRLESFCKENFEQLLSDRGVVPSLNELHRLVEEAKSRKLQSEAEESSQRQQPVVAPHTLPPSALYSSHLAPFLAAQHDDMSRRLTEVQGANASVMQEIQAQRTEMERLVASLEQVVADVEQSSRIMGGNDVQALVTEVRGMETELRV